MSKAISQNPQSLENFPFSKEQTAIADSELGRLVDEELRRIAEDEEGWRDRVERALRGEAVAIPLVGLPRGYQG